MAVAEPEESPDRAAVAEVVPGEALVDDRVAERGFRARARIPLVEVAAGQQGRPQGREEARDHRIDVGGAVAHEAAVRLDGHARVPAASAEQRRARHRRVRDARRGPQPIEQVELEPLAPRLGVAASGRIDGEHHQVRRVEAGTLGAQVGERAHEQAGADEEDEGERDLPDDQGLSQAQASGHTRGLLLQREPGLRAAGLQGGHEAEQQSRRERHRQREEEHARVDAGVQVDGVGQERDEPRADGGREDEPEQRPSDREQRALHEQLADDAPARRADRQPHRGLSAPRERPGEAQVRDVQAREQQHEDRRRQQHQQRPLQAPAEVRPALRRRQHVEAGGQEPAPLLLRDLWPALAPSVRLEHGLEPGLERGLRLPQREARLQASEDVKPSAAPVVEPVEVRRGLLLHHRRDPQRGDLAPIDTLPRPPRRRSSGSRSPAPSARRRRRGRRGGSSSSRRRPPRRDGPRAGGRRTRRAAAPGPAEHPGRGSSFPRRSRR